MFFKIKNTKMTALITSLVNPKGGSGKTVAAVNLAAGIADLSYKVLLIDLDAHASASLALGLKKDSMPGFAGALIADDDIYDFIEKSDNANLDVIKASDDLVAVQVALYNQKEGLLTLKRKIDAIKKNYDYVFIDCPSSFDVLTLNALCASHAFIVPLPCEYYSTSALSTVVEYIHSLEEKGLCHAVLAGILRCYASHRDSVLNEIQNEVVRIFRKNVFNTIIPEDKSLDESIILGQPLVINKPQSPAAQAFRKLCAEFIYKSPFWLRIN